MKLLRRTQHRLLIEAQVDVGRWVGSQKMTARGRGGVPRAYFLKKL